MRVIKRVVEAVAKPFVRRLVLHAYAHPNGPAHRRIQRAARAWYGLDRCGALHRTAARWLIDFVFQIQQEQFARGLGAPLAPSSIGFDDLKIQCHSGDANSSVVYLYGFSDNLTSFALYRRHIAPGSVAIDVGANLGIHTLVLSRCVGAAGRVIAYEPRAPIHQRLQANLALNHADNVVTKPCGLGERTETVRFDDHAGEFNIGKGRVAPQGGSTIDVRTLDEELRDLRGPVSLIKIDVEGAELAVLKGARETLQRHQPALLIEYNPGAYRLTDITACLPYPVRYELVPVTNWESVAPVMPGAVRERTDLLITPASPAT